MAVRLEKALPFSALCFVKNRNTKSESRNQKQIQNSNFLMFKTRLVPDTRNDTILFVSFEFLSFDIVSNFVYRYSSFVCRAKDALPPLRRLYHTTSLWRGR